MKTLFLLLMFIPFIVFGQSKSKGKFISSGIFGTAGASLALGAYFYKQKEPQLKDYRQTSSSIHGIDHNSFYTHWKAHRRNVRTMYALSGVMGAISLFQFTTGHIKIITNKKTQLVLNQNELHLTLNF